MNIVGSSKSLMLSKLLNTKQAVSASTVTENESGTRCDAERSILYIVPRFPTTSQTFVVNEWLKLNDAFRMEIASLFRGKGGPVHRVDEQILPQVWFAPVASIATAKANARLLRRSPRRYLSTLLLAIRRSFRKPAGGALKSMVVFWKSAPLAQRVEQRGIDHVHAHFLHHPATAAWIIARLAGTPFSITVHADDLFLGPGLFQEKLADARFVATISRFNAAYIRERCRRIRRLEVLHCGVDVLEFPFRTRNRVRRLLCVARLEPKKGHHTLLAAFARLLRDHPELSLKVVGDGHERESLEKLARRLGVARAVRFTGALRSDEVRKTLAEADAFVLSARATPRPSLKAGHLDGIPVALMEAMASGLPVVATNVSGIPELVIDGTTGLLVPPDDPLALAFAIDRVVRDETLHAELAGRARAFVEREFNADVQATRLATIFAETMAHRS